MSGSYTLSFAEGLLTFISPCILPMLPIYFLYLAGASSRSQLEEGRRRLRLVANAAAFVFGFSLVFVLMGATATALGSFLKGYADVFRRISGIIMVLFGLNFMGVLQIGFLQTEKRLRYDFKQLTLSGSLLFGMVFGFGWTPCMGMFLGAALIKAGNSDTILQGMLLLAMYSLGLGIPFILSAALFNRMEGLLRAIQRHHGIIKTISGIVLVIGGVLIFFDQLKYLGSWNW